MKLLDLYILKKFLSTYIFVVLIIGGVVCMIDFTEKNDDFIRHNLSAWTILSEYYVNFFPYITNMLSPITVFIATVFVTAQLAGHTEIIAILSSGVSFRRLLVPYMVGALVIGLVSFGLIGWVIPNSNKTRVAFEVAYVKSPYFFEGRNIHRKVGPETYVYMESYNNTINTGYRVTVETIRDAELLEKLSAHRMTWLPGLQKWELQGATLHTFDGKVETVSYPGTVDTLINLLPKDFESTYRLNETFTIPELNEHIEQLQERGVGNVELYVTDRYERYAYPFAIVILTFIGVVISAKKSRSGSGAKIAFGFVLALAYIMMVMMSRSFAVGGGIPPSVAAWIPNVLFAFIGLVLYRALPR